MSSVHSMVSTLVLQLTVGILENEDLRVGRQQLRRKSKKPN